MPAFTFIIASILFFLILSYFIFFRPWQLRWGATDDEIKRAMPGDDIVQKPHFVETRAISIKAPPAEVWKWIIQIGSGRAGFYSIDLIDNANVPSSRNILPKYQRIEQDYFMPFTPDQKNGMWVKDYQESECILWWDRKGKATWGCFLRQTEAGETRLMTRLRTKCDFSFPWIIYYIFYDFGDIIMMSKCMLGIKERAEKNRVNSIAKAFSQVLKNTIKILETVMTKSISLDTLWESATSTDLAFNSGKLSNSPAASKLSCLRGMAADCQLARSPF